MTLTEIIEIAAIYSEQDAGSLISFYPSNLALFAVAIEQAARATPADHSSAELDAVKIAGHQLANTAFNLAQRPGEPLTDAICKTLDTCRKDWDAAIHALKEAQSVRDADV